MKIKLNWNDQEIRTIISENIHRHWHLFLAEGLIFIVLGSLAMVAPHAFTIGITAFLGWCLLVGGSLLSLRVITFSRVPGITSWLIIGLLQIVVGYLLIAHPSQGGMTLTLFMTIYFAVEGITKTYLALLIKPLSHWLWLLFSGATAVVLAIMVWAGWPQTGYWVLGLVVGINLFLLGVTLVRMSLDHRTRQGL